MNVGIVGAGLMGTRRANTLQALPGNRLIAVADSSPAKAQALARTHGAEALPHWEDLVRRKEIQIVIVSTPHHLLSPIALAAVKNGKHVLVEKPMGRSPEEVEALVKAGRACGVLIKGGFNHRYHPALQKAWKLCSEGAIGEILFIRGRYGHGGRPGYETEWRCHPQTAGGGELLDQGIHLITLARWFLGEFDQVAGMTTTKFWPIAPMEENAFALLRTRQGQVVSLHASWTQWKNLFSWEIYGTLGSLTVEGLGGSYGTERLIQSRRRPESGPPEETQEFFSGPDLSWNLEWQEFLRAIEGKEQLHGSAEDGLAAIRIAYAIYRADRYNISEKSTQGTKA